MFVAWNGHEWYEIDDEFVDMAQRRGYEIREVENLREPPLVCNESWLDPALHTAMIANEMQVGMEKLDAYLRAF